MGIIDRRGIVLDDTPSSAGSFIPSASLAIKTPCRVATSGNVALSGLQTIDGVTVVANDRILVKGQTNSVDNGIYVASSGNWVRAVDFNSPFELVKGTQVQINEGTVDAGHVYVVTSSNPIIPGTSALAVTISTAYQASDADLTAISALTSAADKFVYYTGPGAAALASLTAFARTLLAGASALVMRTILGIGVHGADIASAATINLETATGDIVDVTGTTTITAITLSDGHSATVRFTGILTLTNGASLVLPGGSNIITAAGDYAVFRGYAAGVVRCVSYQMANAWEEVASTVTFASPFALTTGGSGVVWNTVAIPRAGLWEVGGNTGVVHISANTPVFTHMHGDHNIIGQTTILTAPGNGATVAQHVTSNDPNGWIKGHSPVRYRTTGPVTVNFVVTTDFNTAANTAGAYGRSYAVRVAP